MRADYIAKSKGSKRCVMTKPPTKNPATAIKDGSCKSLSPEIAWPDVQPPAYLVPNPTRKPPPTIMTKPCIETVSYTHLTLPTIA